MSKLKPIIKTMILTLVCAAFILTGCVKKGYTEYKETGFSNIVLTEKSLEFENQADFTEFKDELKDFKSFNDEFFPIWSDHINRTSYILEDFNTSTILEEKIRYSEILERKYLDFKVNLEYIKTPAIAAKAYELALEGVSCRALFFKKFNEYAPVKELDKIESTAYIAETSFWEEIDNVYVYFDKEMEKLEVVGKSQYVAFE